MLEDGIQVISRERLPLVLDVMRAVSSSLDLATLLPTIMERTTELVHADRSTFFVVDHARDELWSRVAQGLGTTEIRVPIEAGIAGHVARTGETINIPDAYADARFNPEVDRRTGYRTRTILCMPVRNDRAEIIGVVQVLNKIGGHFTTEDEELLQALTSQVSVALENAQLYEETVYLKNYNESILKSMATGVVAVDIEGVVTTLNPAAERIFGATGEAVGQPVAELLRPELNPALVEGLTEAIRAGEDYAAWELRYFTTPEDALNMNLSAHPLRDSKGATLGAVLVIEDITSEKRLMTTLCRYVAREVAEQVLADKDKLQLGGTYQDVTILCADIRDFTTISEQYEAKEIVDLLNGYFKFMFEAIHRYGGTIDKLIGDAILAVFGAPLQHADHAERAARAAIEMRRNLVRFNDLQRQAGRLTVNNGIGLSAGTVLVGNIGAEQRMDYTVIGDAVNVAARLEGLTKQYPTKIVLSGVVYEQIRERIPCLDLGLERVKGRQRAVHLYGIDDGAAQGDGAPLTAAATGT